MVRKKKPKKPGQTYYKSKNNRWYKKIVVDGKTRCRFVSKAEVEGAVNVKKASKAKAGPPTGTTVNPSSYPNSSPPESKPKRRRRRKKADDASLADT
jgi:hypothetical protein